MSFTLTDAEVRHGNGHVALSSITLSLRAGEQVAVIGPSGAGKTSLLRLLATGLAPSAGIVSLWNENPWRLRASGLRRLRSRIGMIYQQPPLPPRQRVVTAVLAGRLGQWSLWRAVTSLLYPSDIPVARQALQRLDLADKLFDCCDQLSGGQLQRVGIARVLYQAPDLVLADEPVSAMDPLLADHTLGVICADARARGATLVTSLHNVELALRHFSRIIGLRDGAVMFDVARENLGPEALAALYANEQFQSDQPVLTPGVITPVFIPRC